MIISQTVGVNLTNCYLIGKKNSKAIVIDPGDDIDKIMDMINEYNVTVEKIVNTHGHFDHITANDELKEKTGAEVYIHEDDKDFLTNPERNLSSLLGSSNTVSLKKADHILQQGDVINIEDYSFEVIHTPGHSPGSICLYDNNNEILISGDTVFNTGVGRTDFKDSSQVSLINSIENKLLKLPGDTKVYPGHGQSTTIKKFEVQVWEKLT
ncbi:MAG: MBL fold metallo-hydrolase [Halanaerobiales bacterium]|nr:MBL fold metallo-hydrolase [Halanaerobiales bacterium]